MKISRDFSNEDLNETLIPKILEDKPVTLPSRVDWPLIKSILTETGNRIICFDYSAGIIVLLYAIGQLKDDQGDNTHYKAAAPLIIYSFNLGVTMTLYPVLSFITPGSRFLGEMASASNELKQAGIKNYSRLPKNTFLAATPFMVASMAALYYADQFWEALGEDSDVTHLVAQFSRPSTLLIPVFLGRMIDDLVLYFRGKAKLVATISMSSLFVGLLLADTLTFNFFGQFSGPDLSILGLFLGVALQMLSSGFVMSTYIAKSAEFKDFDFRRGCFKWLPEDSKQMKELMPLALAYGSTLIAESSVQLVNSRLAGSLGVDQLAAWNYVAEVNFLGALWSHAIAQVAQQNVGIPLSSGDRALAKKTAQHSLAASMLFPLPNLFFLALMVYPRLLTMMDISAPSPEVQEYSETLIRCAAGIAWLNIGQFTMQESLKPTSDYQRPVYLSIGSLWIGAGASYFLSKVLGVYGVIAGSGVGTGLAFASVLPYFEKHFGSFVRSEASPAAALPEHQEARASSSWFSCFSRVRNRWQRGDDVEINSTPLASGAPSAAS